MAFFIYSDLKSWIKKNYVDIKTNPEKSSKRKVGEDIPSGLPISAIASFKGIEN